MTKSKTVPWYSEENGFFGENYLKTYSSIITQKRTKIETDFIIKALKLKKGARILDHCCGHGRHSVELAKRGYNITGLDLQGFNLFSNLVLLRK